MSAIVKVVLTGTLGLLWKKGRQSAAEKLKDGDVTDQQLRRWIIEKFDKINSELEAMAKRDVKASLSFFKEGVVFLDKVMDSEASAETRIFESSAQMRSVEKSAEETELSASGVNTISFVKRRGKLHLTNLDESAEKALCDAKKRFEDARKEATKAFNNAVLTDFDRILALAIRLTATILENIENPADSSAACRSGLGELHSTPFVQENFKVELKGGFRGMLNSDERRQIILWVCQVNRIIHDVFEGEIGILFNWPFIEIENERVDPLRDSRVGKALSKLEMGDCSVTWSIATSIISVATNSRGQFIVIDTYDRCAVLDPTGTFLYSFGLPAEENRIAQGMIRAVATDNDDNIYLCVKNSRNESFVCVKNHARENFSYSFFVQYNFEAVGVMVVGDHVIVPGRELTSPSPNRFRPNDYIERFSYDLEMKTREQNRNNK